MKASMTIEVSYMMPICFLVIMIVCYLGIFQYNQSILKMTGYECILKAMEERQLEDSVLKERLKVRAMEYGEARTLGVDNLSVNVKMTSTKISLTYFGIQSLLEVPIETTVHYERIYPELVLRLKRTIAGGIK